MASAVPLISVKSRYLPVQPFGSNSAPSSLLPWSCQSEITDTSHCIGLVGDFSDISISVRRGGQVEGWSAVAEVIHGPAQCSASHSGPKLVVVH